MDSHRRAPASVSAEGERQSHTQDTSDRAGVQNALTVRLIAKRTPPKTDRRHVYLYDVEFDDEVIVERSSDPACDLARALKARGLAGHAKVVDERGVHRYTVNIKKAALLTVRETAQEGPRFVKWKPLKPGERSPRMGGRGQS